jgi:hypothetical protein
MFRSLLDSSTVVAPALDVDNTMLTASIPDGHDNDHRPIRSAPELNLSPKLINFIKQIRQSAATKHAIFQGFGIITHRCLKTEYIPVQNALSKFNDWKILCAQRPAINPAELCMIIKVDNKACSVNYHRLDPDNWFTHKIAYNFGNVTGLGCFGVSTPDDSIESRKFGDAFGSFMLHHKIVAHTRKLNSFSVAAYDFSRPVKGKFVENFNPDTKNSQLIQYANFLAVKYPGKKIIIPFIEDIKTLCDSVSLIDRDKLPDNVTIFVYQHSAFLQSDIKFMAMIKAVYKDLSSSSSIAFTLQEARAEAKRVACAVEQEKVITIELEKSVVACSTILPRPYLFAGAEALYSPASIPALHTAMSKTVFPQLKK